MPKMEDRPTDGARAFLRYLTEEDVSLTAFCARHADTLDRIAVLRAVRGSRKRISVDFALSIQRATRGRVRVEQWASETSRPARARAA